ncbi:MAG: DUF5011 domain-containing protein [Clostridiales bacterium]|nr:MAG: DUF5011 domain-containing protein [Clostridiales bacterium]
MGVYFADEYGNTGSQTAEVANIDKTPPTLEYTADALTDPSVVSITFSKPEIPTSPMDEARKESEIFVTYGGMTKPVVDKDGNKNSFVFYENGNYTFKIHDAEGRSSYLTITITELDKKLRKSQALNGATATTNLTAQTGLQTAKRAQKFPLTAQQGYAVSTNPSKNADGTFNDDAYPVTNKDVTVTVETDDDTRLIGSSDEYGKIKEKVYDRNGLFIFNTEKKNGLSASYGVDIEVIDKTAPVIDISDLGGELVFYENPKMNSDYDISMLEYVKDGKYTAYKAYDTFNGKTENLTEKVKVDYGTFNPNDLSLNKFDSSKPYTITYTVYDSAHNETTVTRTIRLVGKYDTVALVNGNLPDFSGRSEVIGKDISITHAKYSGTANVRYQSGAKKQRDK